MDTNTNRTSSPWMETAAGKKVQARFSEERTLQAIDHLLARIDTLEKAVESLTTVMQQGPGMLAMATDMADETYRNASARGVNMEQRLSAALQIAEKLTEPEMVTKIEALLKQGEQMPGMVAMTVDMFDEGMRRAVDNGFNPNVLAHVAGTANTALTKANAEEPAKVGGIFGLFRMLKDPDRQKGLGFLMNFLKHFGRNI